MRRDLQVTDRTVIATRQRRAWGGKRESAIVLGFGRVMILMIDRVHRRQFAAHK